MTRIVLNSVLTTTKKVLRMAELTALKAILNLLGGSYYVYVLFINLDNFKGWVLIGLALAFGIMKLYFGYQNGKRSLKERDLKIKDMEREDRRKDRAEQATP